MDKNKIYKLIVFPPLCLLGYVGFQYWTSPAEEKKESEFFGYDSTATPVPESEKERYDARLARIDKKKKMERKIQSTDDFFSIDTESPEENTKIEEDTNQKDFFNNEEPPKKEKPAYSQPNKSRRAYTHSTARRSIAKDPDPEPDPQGTEGRRRSGNVFYSATQATSSGSPSKKGDNKVPMVEFKAVIHGQQEVKSGARVTLRSLEPTVLEGIPIPANTFFWGYVSFQSERINIKVNAIKRGERTVNCEKCLAYDADNMQGLYSPGEFSQDAGNDVFDEAMQELDRQVNIPVVGGIGSTIAKKRVKEPTRILKDGSPITIKSKN